MIFPSKSQYQNYSININIYSICNSVSVSIYLISVFGKEMNNNNEKSPYNAVSRGIAIIQSEKENETSF